MAKNLYILECPVVSVYNSETNEFGKIIRSVQLVPLDYHKQTPDKTETINHLTGTTFLTYKTNNSEVFWAIP